MSAVNSGGSVATVDGQCDADDGFPFTMPMAAMEPMSSGWLSELRLAPFGTGNGGANGNNPAYG